MVLFIATLITPVTTWLESSLIRHVVIMFPLLIFIGILFAFRFQIILESIFSPVNKGGIFGLLLASLLLAFWMIPRWLDASLTSNVIGYLKYASLTLVGLCLSISWLKAHVLVKAIIKIEFLTMLFRLGWLYIISPDRLCNNYLLGEQHLLGRVFLILAITLTIYWLVPIIFGNSGYSRSKKYQP